MIHRRGLIGGVLASMAAPAIIRTPGLLMPVKAARETIVWVDSPNRIWVWNQAGFDLVNAQRQALGFSEICRNGISEWQTGSYVQENEQNSGGKCLLAQYDDAFNILNVDTLVKQQRIIGG